MALSIKQIEGTTLLPSSTSSSIRSSYEDETGKLPLLHYFCLYVPLSPGGILVGFRKRKTWAECKKALVKDSLELVSQSPSRKIESDRFRTS